MSEVIEIEAPNLYPKQHAAIFDKARHSFIEASTKAGKTLGCLVWQTDQCFRVAGEHWWIAPVYGQARIAYERAKGMLPEHIFTHNDSRQEIYLINGARWAFKGSDNPDRLYGEDVWSAVIDEASRCKEATWPAIRSTLTATQGPTRVIGNVKGRKNWFYRLAQKAKQGKKGSAYHKLTAHDAVEGGVIPASEVEEARADLPDHVFRELYLAEATEDGSNPFGQTYIEQQVAPLSGLPAVAWGWDLAKSVDWVVGVGLDANGVVCELHRWQSKWKETIKRINGLTDAPALVDSTGVGDPVLEHLNGAYFQGFRFSAGSKQQLMERLAMAIQTGMIWFPEGVLLDELLSFEYHHRRNSVKYAAPEGMHDDCVDALALALRQWERVPKQRSRNKQSRKIRVHKTMDIGL